MNKLVAVVGAVALASLVACGIDWPSPDGSAGVTAVTTRGEVIASATCAPCHGTDLAGGSFDETPTPSLEAVQGYTQEQFDRLLSTGQTIGPHSVNAAMVTREISSLSPADRQALHEYLTYYWTP
jgi:mono/diheme cytochrome c family protein